MITTHVKQRYYYLIQLFFSGMGAAIALSLFYPFVLRRYSGMVELAPLKTENLLWVIESPILLLFLALQLIFFATFLLINRLNQKLDDPTTLGLAILIWLLVSLLIPNSLNPLSDRLFCRLPFTVWTDQCTV